MGVIKMEAEETFTLSGEEKISQRRPEYTEDDINRPFIVSLTLNLFGLQNVKLADLNQRRSNIGHEGSLSQNTQDWLRTKPSMSTFNHQSSEDIEEAMAGGLNKANIYMPPI